MEAMIGIMTTGRLRKADLSVSPHSVRLIVDCAAPTQSRALG